MLQKNVYNTYRKELREIVFSGMQVKPQEIMKKLFGIDKNIDCAQFFLISTNSVKNIEELWGTFYVIPTNLKKEKYIVLFEDVDKKRARFTGCVEWFAEREEIVIYSLLNKKDHITISSNDATKFPGLITTIPETKRACRIRKEHWNILKKYFKKIDVNI